MCSAMRAPLLLAEILLWSVLATDAALIWLLSGSDSAELQATRCGCRSIHPLLDLKLGVACAELMEEKNLLSLHALFFQLNLHYAV